jgi:hypothetical protein
MAAVQAIGRNGGPDRRGQHRHRQQGSNHCNDWGATIHASAACFFKCLDQRIHVGKVSDATKNGSVTRDRSGPAA